MSDSLDRHVVRLAARKLGGHAPLRRFLDIPCGQLLRWMAGLEPLPRNVYMRLLAVALGPARTAPKSTNRYTPSSSA